MKMMRECDRLGRLESQSISRGRILNQKERQSLKTYKKKILLSSKTDSRAGGVAQVAEHLPSKCEFHQKNKTKKKQAKKTL
jgi:hypothetical protein